MSIKISGKEISVVVFGGATRGGSGFGITPSGKIIKIPDNNPLRDALALAEVIQSTSNATLKAQLERNIAETVAGMR
jgi:hypothetical protein